MSSPVITRKTLAIIYLTLLALVLATWAIAHFNLGVFNLIAALGIASAKMLLIILYFMHVRRASPRTWLFVSAGFFWLAILILLTLTDYLHRPL